MEPSLFTPAELDAAAHALYDACPSVKPAWGSIGDVCKGVWADYVLAGKTPDDYR